MRLHSSSTWSKHTLSNWSKQHSGWIFDNKSCEGRVITDRSCFSVCICFLFFYSPLFVKRKITEFSTKHTQRVCGNGFQRNAYLWKERFLSPQSTFVLQCVKCGLNAPTPVFYTELKHFPVSVGTLQWDRVRVEWVDLKFVFIIIIQNLPITVVKIVWYLKTKEHHTRQVFWNTNICI